MRFKTVAKSSGDGASGGPSGAAIRPSGQTSSNYVITYVDGVLQIIARPAIPEISPVARFNQQTIAAQFSHLASGLPFLARYSSDYLNPSVRIIAGGLRLVP